MRNHMDKEKKPHKKGEYIIGGKKKKYQDFLT